MKYENNHVETKVSEILKNPNLKPPDGWKTMTVNLDVPHNHGTLMLICGRLHMHYSSVQATVGNLIHITR